MTIVVNAVSAKMGGAETYLRALVRELAAGPATDRFIFFVPPEQAPQGRDLPRHIEWRVTRSSHAGAVRRFWWDQVTLRRILRRERTDALYSTANFALLCSPVPQLLLARNALYFSPLYRSRYLPLRSRGFRLAFPLRTFLARVSLARASALMTPSHAHLEELRACGARLPRRCEVNPYGVNRPKGQAAAAPRNQTFRLLYPSLYAEHKNLSTLLDAVARLRQESQLDLELTTTADPAWGPAGETTTGPADLARARDPAVASRIRIVAPELVPEADALYAGCDAVVYPTLVESFGHPLLEAMARGLPVIASDIPVNRELGGSAPLYFQSLDAADLAEKILRVARDSELRARMSAAGRERARDFTWPAHVARLRSLLAEIAAERA